MNKFLVHLSLADLLTALLTLLPEIAWTLTSPLFHGGDLVCRTVKFLQMLGPYLSSFLLCVTSIDRYRAICRPFKSKQTNVGYSNPRNYKCDISFRHLLGLLGLLHWPAVCPKFSFSKGHNLESATEVQMIKTDLSVRLSSSVSGSSIYFKFTKNQERTLR